MEIDRFMDTLCHPTKRSQAHGRFRIITVNDVSCLFKRRQENQKIIQYWHGTIATLGFRCADEGLIIGVGNPAPMVIPVSIRKDEQGNWQACPEYWGLFLYRDETGKTEYEFGRLGVRITR